MRDMRIAARRHERGRSVRSSAGQLPASSADLLSKAAQGSVDPSVCETTKLDRHDCEQNGLSRAMKMVLVGGSSLWQLRHAHSRKESSAYDVRWSAAAPLSLMNRGGSLAERGRSSAPDCATISIASSPTAPRGSGSSAVAIADSSQIDEMPWRVVQGNALSQTDPMEVGGGLLHCTHCHEIKATATARITMDDMTKGTD